MHAVFRAKGQQMGMQTIRGILPESIDIYLNSAIVNKVRSIVLENTDTVYRDKVTVQRNEIAPINSLRSLYEVRRFPVLTGSGSIDDPFNTLVVANEDIMYYTGIVTHYGGNKSYNCRIVDGDSLANTLNDFCNRSSIEYPVSEIKFNDVNNTNTVVINIYTEDATQRPLQIGVRYIRKPAVVKYALDDPANDINCNLPTYLHGEIVTLAVNEYFQSVGSTAQDVN
jgi:hypothetical protein